jgi:hypothetical protein
MQICPNVGGTVTERQEQTPNLPIPRSDDEVFRLLHPFPVAVANAIGATVQMDQIITVQEYQALARVAKNLENLTPLPGLMSALVLKAVLDGTPFNTAMQDLRTRAQDRPEGERKAVFDAVLPLMQLQDEHSETLARKWTSALHLQDSTFHSAADKIKTALDRILSGFRSLRLSKESLAQKAQRFARTYDDPQLAVVVQRVLSGDNSISDAVLRDELSAAIERVFRNTASVLKSQEVLDEQIEVTERFLKTAEALVEQIHLRLLSIKDRLDLQNQMFEEDVEDFVKKAADRVELRMRDLVEGSNWADETIWERFRNGEAYSETLAAFKPLKHRYERLFDLWHKELDLFTSEANVIRAGILMNIDPHVFQGLLPTPDPTVSFRNAIDSAANITLGAILAGGVAAVMAHVAVPFLPLIGAIGGVALVWKMFSKPDARKRKLVQTNRQILENKLIELLKGEALNHTNLAEDIMNRFVQAAVNHYAPLVIESRMAALRAKLEAKVVHRVLSDTRKVLMPSS